MTDFNQIINRKNTSSEKWDNQGGDYIPLWVADMDFKSPQPITDAIIKRANHGVFGYTAWQYTDELKNVVYDFYKREYNLELDKEWIIFVPSVMPGATIACKVAGGDIMYNTPMYTHIRKLYKEVGKNAIEIPLKIEAGKYTFDFEAMQKAINKDIKAFILCNPHNPVGRVYTQEELEKVVEFCDENDLLLISDEIHSELILEGKHIPAFAINEKAKERSITIASAAKTYNIPAMPIGFVIIPNREIRNKFKKEILGLYGQVPVLTVEAFKAAYKECREWREELLEYLRGNRDYIEERVSDINGLSINHNQGTYLAWIDARKLNLDDPYKYFLDNANIKFSDGRDFGQKGFIRINFGCPRSTLKEAFDKIEKLLNA